MDLAEAFRDALPSVLFKKCFHSHISWSPGSLKEHGWSGSSCAHGNADELFSLMNRVECWAFILQ